MQVINTKNINKLKYFDTLYQSINQHFINSENFKRFCIINMEDAENVILNSEISFLKEDFSKRKILNEQELLNGSWYYRPKIYKS